MPSSPAQNRDELRKIIDMVDDINPLVSAMLEMEARTGLRYSDTSRLKFSDVMINGVVRESFVVVMSKSYNARLKKGIKDAVAKEKSKITIHVSKDLAELIERIHDINGKHKLLFQSDHHLAGQGKAISIQYINRVLKKVAAELRLPYQLSTHSMRKTFAMLLEKNGAKLTDIRDLLGHSDAKITDHYLRGFIDEKKKFSDSIDF